MAWKSVFLTGLSVAFLAAPAVAQTPGETVLYAFQGGNDGEYVTSGLVSGSGGVLYGTTYAGGGGNCVAYWSNGQVVGCGTVFELTPPATVGGAWTETIIHAFTGGSDGAFPNTLLAGTSGILYGSTGGGGTGASGGDGNGVVFELAPPKTAGGAWKETVYYSFCKETDCTDGSTPGDGLLLSGGALYGTTDFGGASGNGTVYELTLPKGTAKAKLSTIYSFQGGDDGATPFFGVIAGKSGTLYGVTYAGGGTGCGGSGCGTAYELTPPATAGNPYTETILHPFSGPDGQNPTGRFNMLKGGVLLGVAGGGGSTGYGLIYELTPPTTGSVWSQTILTTFGENDLYGIPDGSYPDGNLVVGSNGSIYGTTYGGGDPNLQMGFYYPGTIFELTPPIETGGAWVRSLLYSFQGGSDGLSPGWGLITGPDGTLYGTTETGGGSGCPAQNNTGCGTVFQFTP